MASCFARAAVTRRSYVVKVENVNCRWDVARLHVGDMVYQAVECMEHKHRGTYVATLNLIPLDFPLHLATREKPWVA